MKEDFKEIEFRLAMHQVSVVRWVSQKAFVVRMDRNNLPFKPGQHIKIGLKNDSTRRYYSIYSGEKDPFLEMLVVEVDNGVLTQKLKRMSEGDELEVVGPKGLFLIKENEIKNHKYLFVATGTGIAPYRSFIRSYPALDYTILHGTRFSSESYDRGEYDRERYVSCTSRDEEGDFNGRVTDYLQETDIESDVLIYLCGNNSMIKESIDILQQKGVEGERIRTEIYF